MEIKCNVPKSRIRKLPCVSWSGWPLHVTYTVRTPFSSRIIFSKAYFHLFRVFLFLGIFRNFSVISGIFRKPGSDRRFWTSGIFKPYLGLEFGKIFFSIILRMIYGIFENFSGRFWDRKFSGAFWSFYPRVGPTHHLSTHLNPRTAVISWWT